MIKYYDNIVAFARDFENYQDF
ncbi:Protein of unknown function [Lactobacillus acidophilus DSM 9126]|nr:Protein of unknown function [Lactobacillus acidophilus DSM 20079 = JCM 1132 = NBRC 13951 = CIP 76.13]CDF68505.1 Protein of unknown function [Lactobacillus acidophilus CIRM-BIA 442]CDF72266.1 Protein of unknown function [Lactobacillus acidophilus CIRM-BIA 445]CDF74086.1 Protein of unknown function [Lactobacillus acidophilus DSM 9126]CDF76093.1 Protein of unknown function [Lactobacillus acidophilus DSM 20242]